MQDRLVVILVTLLPSLQYWCSCRHSNNWHVWITESGCRYSSFIIFYFFLNVFQGNNFPLELYFFVVADYHKHHCDPHTSQECLISPWNPTAVVMDFVRSFCLFSMDQSDRIFSTGRIQETVFTTPPPPSLFNFTDIFSIAVFVGRQNLFNDAQRKSSK